MNKWKKRGRERVCEWVSGRTRLSVIEKWCRKVKNFFCSWLLRLFSTQHELLFVHFSFSFYIFSSSMPWNWSKFYLAFHCDANYLNFRMPVGQKRSGYFNSIVSGKFSSERSMLSRTNFCNNETKAKKSSSRHKSFSYSNWIMGF